MVLARAGVHLLIADDDVVDESNLHRQLLFENEDVGKPKLEAGKRRLELRGCRAPIELVRSRFLPNNALRLAERVDVLVEGADNYATKFLAADAARLAKRPIVHGAAVGWRGTAWSVGASGRPCYRCLFEDVPAGEHQSCDSAGVMGPVPGFIGALMADLTLGELSARPRRGLLHQYDGRTDRLRTLSPSARPDCPLCGSEPTISEIEEGRYMREVCAA
jgi:molybdopterin/thiamine biosynthesis adenylyltransferase